MARRIPSIGNWFCDQETHQLFEVIAFDERAGTIEIQYADGELGEYDLDNWSQLQLKPAYPPEDADIAYEIDPEQQWSDGNMPYANILDSIDSLEPDSFQGTDEF